MKFIKGDLIALAKAGEFEVIVQGCNCMNSMGSGLALQWKKEFPESYEDFKGKRKGDRIKLGTFGARTYSQKTNILTVINAYTQYDYGNDGKDRFEYDAFGKILREFAGIDAMWYNTLRWGFPLIGCGLARGNKDRILEMIEQGMPLANVTIVEFNRH